MANVACQLLFVVLCLVLVCCSADAAAESAHTSRSTTLTPKSFTHRWLDFDISEHVFTGRWNDQVYRGVVWLRVLCDPTSSSGQVLARVVVTLNNPDVVNLDGKKYHAYTPRKFLSQDSRTPEIYFQAESTNDDTANRIAVEQLDKKRLRVALVGKAQLNSNTLYKLHMEGSELSFAVSTYECSSSHELFQGEPVWLGVVENVVKKREMEQHQFLLTHHLQHHLTLGMRGTLLVCTPETAYQLLAYEAIKKAVEAKQLVLILWDGGLIRDHPLIMQVPANNLLMLAASGSSATIGLWDLDEFLVLPHGRPIADEVRDGCLQRVKDPKEYEQVLTLALTFDTAATTPDLPKWREYGSMLEAAKHMNYTSRPYKHCDNGMYCKALVNPNTDLAMHVHQLVRQVPEESTVRTPTAHDCAFLHHFWFLWVVRPNFWDQGVLGPAQVMELKQLPQT